MAVRRVHNRMAKIAVPNAPMNVIDAVNRDVDDPKYLKKYGKDHRKHHGHDPNPYSPDSLSVNHGNAMLERLRQTHIIVDTNPKIKRLIKRMEIREEIKKMKGGK